MTVITTKSPRGPFNAANFVLACGIALAVAQVIYHSIRLYQWCRSG